MKSLYVHFPFCRHLCNYCDFYKKIQEHPGQYSQFEEQLQSQWEKLKIFANREGEQLGPFETIYFGGGTPSLWGERGAKFFQEFLAGNKIELSEGCEWTMEVNPKAWSKQGLEEWQSLGVNRFSLGVQALDSRFLELLDRVHDLDDVYETLQEFQRREVSFSVDFMLGLPDSKRLNRDIQKELEEILSFGPEHLSLYILTTGKKYVHAQSLPSEDWIADEYQLVADFLKAQGFEHYEVSNFAKPLKRSRHNMAYWKCDSVAAIGPSATGYIASTHKRFKWHPVNSEPTWEELNCEQVEIENIYMSLRSDRGLDLNKLSSCELRDSDSLGRVIESWKRRDLVYEGPEGRWKATSRGYLVLDSLMDELFSLM